MNPRWRGAGGQVAGRRRACEPQVAGRRRAGGNVNPRCGAQEGM